MEQFDGQFMDRVQAGIMAVPYTWHNSLWAQGGGDK